MLTGAIRNQVSGIWNAIWAGGIANPLTAIEQLTYLLFAKRLDEIHIAEEAKANLLKNPIESSIFSEDQQHLRWSVFKNLEPGRMFEVFKDEVFPFIKELGNGAESSYSRFMKDAVFMVPNAGLLDRLVTMLDEIPMEDRDTKGDLYEYLLRELSLSGKNGQFRTPRHIIKMMVELVDPKPTDVIGDPACGTCGFLVAAGEYLREQHPEIFRDPKLSKHFEEKMFHGADFDASMLRIGAMNMMLHGIENPHILSVDSLSQEGSGIRDRYTLALANPPFRGSLNYDEVAKDLLQETKTKKTELLFLALFQQQLKIGGRAGVIVPDGVLFGSSKGHRQIRQSIVDHQKLDAVISMPSGVFKPYASVSTAVLMFTRTDSGGTDHVWFYDMEADGYSLDDKREEVEENDIPDLIEKWKVRNPQRDTDRKAKAFFVPVDEIRKNNFEFSINLYKELEFEAIEYDPPGIILGQLEALEIEIQKDLTKLRTLL